MDRLIQHNYGYNYLLSVLNDINKLEFVYKQATISKSGINDVSPEYQNIRSALDYYVSEMIKNGEINKHPEVLGNYKQVFNRTINNDLTYILKNDVINLPYEQIKTIMSLETYRKIQERKTKVDQHCKSIYDKYLSNTITQEEKRILMNYLRDNIGTTDIEIHNMQETICQLIINNQGNYGYEEADFIVRFIGNEECKKYGITGLCHLSEYRNSVNNKFPSGMRGIASFGTVSVAKDYGIQAINNKGKDLSMLLHTICHEVKHVEQNNSIADGICNLETMSTLYDKIFRQYLHTEDYNYYKQNYFFEAGELDAEIAGYMESISYLRKYGQEVPSEVEEEMYKLKDKQIYKRMIEMRKDQSGNKINANYFRHQQMKKLIASNPKLLETYPQLQHIYNQDGSLKSFETLLLDSADFKKNSKKDSKDIYDIEFSNAIDANQLSSIQYDKLNEEDLFKIIHELAEIYNKYAREAHNFLTSHRQGNNFLYDSRVPEQNTQFIEELKERTKLMASRYQKLERVLDPFYNKYGHVLEKYDAYKSDQFIYNKDKQYTREQFGKIKELYFKKEDTNQQQKSNELAEKMIEGMVNGMIDIDGNSINPILSNPDNKKMGYTGFQLLALTSLISSIIIAVIGIIFVILV